MGLTLNTCFMNKLDVTVVLPTYNEAENLPLICEEIANALKKHKYEILVVDDNSPDGTWKVAEKLGRKYPLRVIRRYSKLGLSSAILTGFYNAKAEFAIVMDADLQHEASVLPKMLKILKNDHCDLVIGSRYTANGTIDRAWPLKRRLDSKLATLLARPLTSINDPMSGFFGIKKSLIEKMDQNWLLIGYKLLVEILAKTDGMLKICEIPIQFKQRLYGETKLNKKEVFNYLKLICKLYWQMIWREK